MFVLRYVFGNDRHQNVAEVYSASRLVFGWLPFKNYNTIFGVRFAGLFATLTVRQFCFRRARGSFMSFHAGRLIFSHKLSSTPTRASKKRKRKRKKYYAQDCFREHLSDRWDLSSHGDLSFHGDLILLLMIFDNSLAARWHSSSAFFCASVLLAGFVQRSSAFCILFKQKCRK